MSEQNPKQNIIRFPLSRRERRQRLLDSKDARIRTTALLRMLCGWALVLGTALFLIANYRIFTPTSLRTLGSYIAAGIRSHDGDITTINYENETFSDGALFESGLAYADSDALFLSRAGSMTTLRYSLGYSDPAVESSTNYVLVYDRGGVKAALVGSAGAVAELELESLAFEKNVTLDTDLPEKCVIRGNADYLLRIVTSLLENALKYEPSGGQVTLTLTQSKRKIQLCVQNRGSQIQEEDLPHVFDRFYRGDKSRTNSEGSFGLGLAITKEMTQRLGGTITVTSSEAEGTTFRVTFEH